MSSLRHSHHALGETPEPARATRRCLDRAAAASLETQRSDGSWATPAQPRILENAVVPLALAKAGCGCPHQDRAHAWLRQAEPQRHDAFTAAADEWFRALALNPAVPPAMPALPRAGAAHRRRLMLLHTIGVAAGAPNCSPRELHAHATAALGPEGGASLTGWHRAQLLSAKLIAGHAVGLPVDGDTVAALTAEQAADGSFHAMPLVAATACLALALVAPGRAATRGCTGRLLADQHTDGTWRFTTFDIWDTGLMVRCLRGHSVFDTRARPRALDFLARAQSPQGGWGSVSAAIAGNGLACDADTTGSTLLALAGTGQGRRAWPAAAGYARDHQDDRGLWTTWTTARDTVAQDTVAHMVAGIRAHGPEEVDVTPAARWLRRQHRGAGGWTADWYVFPGYPAAEISPAVGWHTAEARAEARALASAQNRDGGWPAFPGGSRSSPAATGLAATVLTRCGTGTPQARARAARFLIDSQRDDGTWTEPDPSMCGPRPFLTDVPSQAHALTCRGLIDLLRGPPAAGAPAARA
ncbi:terpene cyclase/mutase family protein [Streptomyces sp. B1866]|uniref:prenyltransferase/squalene oxidase repeat-containing protein n=1 Tax=Streptomyces sp. B1866 TaxID=3075431 RepID=UPI00288D9112|nr:prenyltransferase/squalene oxidase repeat-containing protein [Streptomyces sp. B1866]MDT3396400.1 terpene cyclase/mutase family protein [Streptomyces sp. B1866]